MGLYGFIGYIGLGSHIAPIRDIDSCGYAWLHGMIILGYDPSIGSIGGPSMRSTRIIIIADIFGYVLPNVRSTSRHHD